MSYGVGEATRAAGERRCGRTARRSRRDRRPDALAGSHQDAGSFDAVGRGPGGAALAVLCCAGRDGQGSQTALGGRRQASWSNAGISANRTYEKIRLVADRTWPGSRRDDAAEHAAVVAVIGGGDEVGGKNDGSCPRRERLGVVGLRACGRAVAHDAGIGVGDVRLARRAARGTRPRPEGAPPGRGRVRARCPATAGEHHDLDSSDHARGLLGRKLSACALQPLAGRARDPQFLRDVVAARQ